MAAKQLLIIGATGYIGGSILAQLQASANPLIQELDISALVRTQTQADKLKSMGVNPILFKGFDDLEQLKKVASEHDIIINTSATYYADAAKALVQGAGERKAITGKEVHFIHVSGTSNLGDYPITKKYVHPAGRVFSDKEDIYAYLKEREAMEAYAQRTSDINVVETGEEKGVKTYVLMSPCIYGVGLGAFNRLSIQIPMMTAKAIEQGVAQYVGEGKGVWDHVHIADLAVLYELFLGKILAGEELVSGRRGFYFNGTGRHSGLSVAECIAKAGHELGVLKSATPESMTMEEVIKNWGVDPQLAELGFASDSMTSADRSRELGWKPTKTEEDWNNTFKEEFQLVLEKSKSGDKIGYTH